MESVSNTLDNSDCLQPDDKQGTPSGTQKHVPHEVNEEEDKAKNMTAEGCKHPDMITQRQHIPQVKQQALPFPGDIIQHVFLFQRLRISVVRGSEKCRTKCVHAHNKKVNFTLHYASDNSISSCQHVR